MKSRGHPWLELRPWGYGLVHLLHVRRGSDGVRVAAAEDLGNALHARHLLPVREHGGALPRSSFGG